MRISNSSFFSSFLSFHITPPSFSPLFSIANKAVRPRNVATASIPGLLATFQNEWDEVMLEVFTLKQHLDTTRKELSQALYQHDAACRVIARLMRERDEARSMLISGQGQGQGQVSHSSSSNSNDNGAATMEVEVGSSSVEKQEHATWGNCISGISAKSLELQAARKQRPKKIPSTTRTKESLSNLLLSAVSATPHKNSPAGITCMAFNEGAAGGVGSILTGGADKDIHLTSHVSGKSLCKISRAHEKKVSCVAHHSDTTRGMFMSGGHDNMVKLWGPSTQGDYSTYTQVSSYSTHKGTVSAVCAHPMSSLACSFSTDGTVACLELEQEVVAMQISEKNVDYEYLCGDVHPDAVMLAGGTNSGALKVWDIRQAELAVSLTDHSINGVTAVSFSNNGYYVCTGDASGTLRLWDLRKIECLRTQKVSTEAVGCISFDDYGLYAAIGGCGDGSAVQLWNVKSWEQMANLENIHTKAVTGVAWGTNASCLVTASMDKSIRVHM